MKTVTIITCIFLIVCFIILIYYINKFFSKGGDLWIIIGIIAFSSCKSHNVPESAYCPERVSKFSKAEAALYHEYLSETDYYMSKGDKKKAREYMLKARELSSCK